MLYVELSLTYSANAPTLVFICVRDREGKIFVDAVLASLKSTEFADILGSFLEEDLRTAETKSPIYKWNNLNLLLLLDAIIFASRWGGSFNS